MPMKKSTTIVGLLMFALCAPTQAMADNNELCLRASSPATQSTNTMTLSYSGLKAGHVQVYGDSCYIIPAANGLPESRDCMPVHGNGILHENKIELAVLGIEKQADLGIENYASILTHISLSLDTLTGTLANETVAYSAGQPTPVEFFGTATVEAVTCPAVTADEEAADKKFRQAVKRLDRR
jgi:hypothetical protein